MMRAFRYPPAFCFLDERIERRSRRHRTIVGCCLFRQDRWLASRSRVAAIGGLRRRRRLGAIEELLSSAGGTAILAYADLADELIPSGEIDGTADIPRMSRTDNVWSQMTLTTVFAAVARLQSIGIPLGTVDLYYDQKNLTVAHQRQFETVLRETLPQIAREAANEHPSLFPADAAELQIGRIQGVPKCRSGQPGDEFQEGTSLAHHLCTQAPAIILRGTAGAIEVRDLAPYVRDMISKFTESHVS